MTEEVTKELSVELPSDPGFHWTLRARKFSYLAARNDGDFRKAAKEAGYKDPEYGYVLWAKPQIKAEIERQLLSCLQKDGENSETIMARWVRMVQANLGDYFKMDQDGNFVAVDFSTLTKEQTSCIKSIAVTNNQYGQNVKIELHSVEKAQDRLAEICGLINSQTPVGSAEDTAVAIRELIGQMHDTRFNEVPADVTLQ